MTQRARTNMDSFLGNSPSARFQANIGLNVGSPVEQNNLHLDPYAARELATKCMRRRGRARIQPCRSESQATGFSRCGASSSTTPGCADEYG